MLFNDYFYTVLTRYHSKRKVIKTKNLISQSGDEDEKVEFEEQEVR